MPPKALLHLLNPTVRSKKGNSADNEGTHTYLDKKKPQHVSHSDEVKPPVIDGEPAEGSSRKGKTPMFVRRPGESRKDYFERIDIETKIKVADCMRKEKKSDKRKR